MYLKSSDEKSRREIEPREIGTMEFKEKQFLGVRGFCRKRREERVFRVDRILEMTLVR